MTNLGPLTTTFTPIPACFSEIWGLHYIDAAGIVYTDQLYFSYGPVNTLICYPSNFKPTTDAYYSPGICPLGWAAACMSQETIGIETETRATCCPKGYFCQKQTQNGLPWYSTLPCTSHTSIVGSWRIFIFDEPNSSVLSDVIGEQGVQGYGVNVRWRQADFTTTTTTTSSSSSSSKLPATPGSSITLRASITSFSSQAVSTNTSSASDFSGFSTKAKAGIGSVAAVAALALFGLIAFIVFNNKRRKSAKYTSPEMAIAPGAPGVPCPYKGNPHEPNDQLDELPSQELQESQDVVSTLHPLKPESVQYQRPTGTPDRVELE